MDKRDTRAEEPGKRLLGCGRAAHYRDALRPGERLLEEGRCVYAVAADFFCTGCEGAGCNFCKFDGRASAQRAVSEKKRQRAAVRELRKETSTECSKHPRQPVIGYSVSGYSELSYAGEQDGCRCDAHKVMRAERAR